MTLFRKILFGLATVFVVIQFVRPTKNDGDTQANAMSKKYSIPENVQSILKQSCYDCHSNKTTYPWYANIQPVGWWIQYSHINDGKRHLNFSEFASYPEKRARKKIEEIADEVREGGMPLSSYTLMHHDAVLSQEQAKTLIDWAEGLR
jgi:hypothetical protein